VDLNGIILIDKKPAKTSFENVKKIKKILVVNKVGHSGTLDKFATGLLIICINQATSFQNIFMKNDKVYKAVIKFGEQTDTLDPYGRLIKQKSVKDFTTEEIANVLSSFVGEIDQYPPLFSAIKINGKRLYRRTLDGEKIDISPRRVVIHWIKSIDIQRDRITIEVKVSKGTYIRALARDIAEKLGTVGYCESLRRVSIGNFNVEDAISIEDVNPKHIISINEALSYLPNIEVNEDTATKVSSGFPAYILFEDIIADMEDKYIRVLYKKNLIAVLEKEKKIKYYKVLGMVKSDHN